MVSPRTSHDAKGLTQRSTEWPDGRSTQALAHKPGTARNRSIPTHEIPIRRLVFACEFGPIAAPRNRVPSRGGW